VAFVEAIGRFQASMWTLLQRLQAEWLRQKTEWTRAAVRFLKVSLAALVAATAAANVWGRQYVDAKVLPVAADKVSLLLGRKVALGRTKWIIPLGLTGAVPAARVGPLSVGPSEKSPERTSLDVEDVILSLKLWQSLWNRKVLLSVGLRGVQGQLYQLDNLSWFGFPEDTSPPCRDLLPGLDSFKREAVTTESPSEVLRAAARLLERQLIPSVGLHSLNFQGDVDVHIAGERGVRRLRDIMGSLTFSKGYERYKVLATCRVPDRDPEAKKCTMPHPHARRHLRDVAPKPGPSQTAPRGDSMGYGEFKQKISDALRGLREPVWQISQTGIRLADPGGEERSLNNEKDPGAPGTSGVLDVSLVGKHLHRKDREGDVLLTLTSKGIDAANFERILNIPLDIDGGRMNGEVGVRFHDAKTWHDFPDLSGKLRVSDGEFHIWNAPDDFEGVNVDLVFEGSKIFLHNCTGKYGAIPLALTGSIGVDPKGEFRMIGDVLGVEANGLRETMAVRPPPFPLHGYIKGSLSITGELEHPVYSGTATAYGLPQEEFESAPPGMAKEAVLKNLDKGAIAAYQKIPMTSAKAVFTFDETTKMLTFHSMEAEPVGGGRVKASGTIWCVPNAEEDPRAVNIHAEGFDLPGDTLLRHYVPDGAQVPPSIQVGSGHTKGSIIGGHMSPRVDFKWEAPEAAASGSLLITRKKTQLVTKSPFLDASATLQTRYQPKEVMLQVTKQEEATRLSRPVIEGADIECRMKNLDVMPLVSSSEPTDHVTSNQPMRLRMSGMTHFKGKLAEKEGFPKGFNGNLSLKGLQFNHLNLARDMAGKLAVNEEGMKYIGRGMRPDESVDIDLNLPQILSFLKNKNSWEAPDAAAPSEATSLGSNESEKGQAQSDEASGTAAAGQKSSFIFRNRGLRCRAGLDEQSAHVSLANLRLDELELASLRGLVEQAKFNLDLSNRTGRGDVSVAGPRFSGLAGDLLSGCFRWDGDIIRLEQALLQQQKSRYELQGEYVLPNSNNRGVLDIIPLDKSEAFKLGAGGRWRWQVLVPGADVEEMLPAAQILSSASRVSPGAYSEAKAAFLKGVENAAINLDGFSEQLEKVLSIDGKDGGTSSGKPASLKSFRGDARRGAIGETMQHNSGPALPALQDLHGRWKGSVQAYGGGGGHSAVDFNLEGETWRWGDYNMESVIAAGNFHSAEGLKLERLQMDMGDASLRVAGNILGPNQDALFALTDFPISFLQPLLSGKAEGDSLAMTSATRDMDLETKSSYSLNPFSSRTPASGGTDAVNSSLGRSPLVDGSLYVRGALGGSADVPEGDIHVRLLDGFLGPTPLAKAEANAAVTSDKRLAFDAQLQPASAPGHVRVVGSVPFRKQLPQLSVDVDDKPAEISKKDGDAIEIDAAVKDSGMLLISTISPEVHWESGSADIALKVRGNVQNPVADGVAHLNRALISCPWLSRPLSGLSATIRLNQNTLHVDTFEGKVGRRGHFKVLGSLPIKEQELGAGLRDEQGITLSAEGLEIRARNAFNGTFDGEVTLGNSLMQPQIGGGMRLSKGTAYLIPSGTPPDAEKPLDAADAGPLDIMNSPQTGLAELMGLSGKDLLSPGPVEQSVVANNIWCKGLRIQLGPELRAVYPFVLNFGINGEVEISGPANATGVRPSGTIQFDSGDINLVATQLSLNREHPNCAVFVPEQGLDPTLDVSLTGADLHALIQGKASAWQNNLVITYGGGRTSTEGAERLAPSEAARIFEGQLADSLLEEDGQLAFSNLAATTIATLLPKIETQGQLGKARWRLVSAPTIPGLLSLDPLTDPFKSLANLTLGTEVEVQFGKSLQASVARKLKGSEMATHWTFLYHLNNQLRVRLHSATATPTRLLFEFSREGRGLNPRGD
jgi:hypothetical protein